MPHLAKYLPRLLFLLGREMFLRLHAVQHALLLLRRLLLLVPSLLVVSIVAFSLVRLPISAAERSLKRAVKRAVGFRDSGLIG